MRVLSHKIDYFSIQSIILTKYQTLRRTNDRMNERKSDFGDFESGIFGIQLEIIRGFMNSCEYRYSLNFISHTDSS